MRIGTRILVSAWGLVIVVGLVLAAAVSLLTRERFKDELHKKGEFIAVSTARAGLPLRLTDNRLGLQLLANEVLESDPDLVYVYFLDAGGTVLAHTFAGGFPRALVGLNPPRPGEKVRRLLLLVEEGEIDDYAAPVSAGRLGEAHVGLSHKVVVDQTRQLLAMIAAVTAATLLLGSIAAYFLARALSRPLGEMSVAAIRVGTGRLEERVPVRSGDEIGRLAATFNAMVEDLQRAAELREQSELVMAEQLHLQRLTADIGVALTRESSLESMLGSCTDAIVARLGVAFARIWILDQATGVLQLKASSGVYTNLDGAHSRIPLGDSKVGRIALENKPHLTNDVQNDPLVTDRAWASREGMVGFAGHPLTVGEKVVGVVGMFSRSELPEATLRSLSGVADILATGIERRRADDALRRNREFIRRIVDSVDEGFVVLDRDYAILDANQAYCDAAGCPSDRITGRRCHEVTHDSSRPCWEDGEECPVRSVFATGQPAQAVHRHRDREGGVIHVQTKAFPLTTDADGVTSVIETVSNITERFLLEEQRLKAQKLESIGTLAGGIAHDFNNLLQGVFGYISLAKANLGRDERTFRLLDEAEHALGRATSLTTQLLTFSKGGLPVKERIALGPLVQSAVRFCMSGARAKERIDIAQDLWEVEADRGQLAQVIQNLVLNALEAMPRGGAVTVTAHNVGAERPPFLREGKYVAVAVGDTGCGIPAEELPRVFDPYFTTKEKGSGLGLATSYSIVRNHGGTIDVRSEPGAGSTFSVYLPALEAAASPAPAPPQPRAARRVRPARILLMDDEKVVREVGESLLVSLGHEAVIVERGEEALERYRQARDDGRPFDLVILDLTIPGGMGGQETMERLLDIDPRVTAIVSSGYSDDAVLANHAAYGFKAVLSKPYRRDALGQILDTLLG